MVPRKPKVDAALRGVALVARAIEALALRAPKPVPPDVLATLTLGGAPLPPSLRAWLAHHDSLPRPVRTRLSPDGLALSPWPAVARRALGRPTLPPDAPPPLAHGGMLPLDVGDSSFRALFAGTPDSAGELPVLDVDADDPSVTLALPGFDVWLAVMAGLVDAKKVRVLYGVALAEHARSSLGDAKTWHRASRWQPAREAAWQPPPLLLRRRMRPTDAASELVETIRDRDLEGVRELLDAGVSAAAPDPSGSLPLAQAAGAGEPEIASLLLERGADPNASDSTRMAPLALVASRDWWWYADAGPEILPRWLACMRVLVRGGGDPNLTGEAGQTPLAHAAYHRALPPLATLVELGADPRRSPLALHALLRPTGRKRPARDAAACVALLLAHGADPDAVGTDGTNPLALAEKDPTLPSEILRALREHAGR